jgi:outer membrane cobalamin receptor
MYLPMAPYAGHSELSFKLALLSASLVQLKEQVQAKCVRVGCKARCIGRRGSGSKFQRSRRELWCLSLGRLGDAATSDVKKYLALLWLCAAPLWGQSSMGELRLKLADPSGLGVKSVVELVCEATHYRRSLGTDEGGNLIAKRLPFGVYRVAVQHPGFAPFSDAVEVRSAIPVQYNVRLSLASVSTAVQVNESATLIDPYSTGSVNRLGTEAIEDRATSLPGRSLQDLVNSQPGWLYEGNAVLHPRGSEYQTQLVVDGIPLTENRSPSFGPEIEADDVQSLSVYTAGIPAEYGRKMGGVIEVTTARDARAGLHGQIVLSGGSFDTASAYGEAQYSWGKNVLGVSADVDQTNRYLNPPVTQNFTNTGTAGDFALRYDRDFSASDRVSLVVRHELSRFLVPNEQLQEAAGQLQNRDNLETMGSVSYQHVFSPNMVSEIRGMVRDDSDGLWSNPLATPIIAFQNRGFREGYFKADIAGHHSRHEWKAGVESDASFLHEQFSDAITDPARFDPGTPATFSFLGRRPDLEQSAFVQDQIRLGPWTLSAGLRWDHYQLLVNQSAFSPRLGIARYVKAADLVLHASYDRVFQTPAFENILLSSSPEIESLNPNILRLPVLPSHGNYYEAGLSKDFFAKVRLDVNYFLRRVNNFADDDQLLNTAVSFPVAFLKADIYGAEGKVDIPRWGKLSGFVSYSYLVASASFPITGGLFLGTDALNAQTQTSGRFWASQDQRNTAHTRFRYQLWPRFWMAGGGEYGSGLPVDFNGTQQQALAQYGQQVVDRVNFARGRVRPSLAMNVSAGADLWKSEKLMLRAQADAANLNNRLNLIDFAGLFSGNAVAPPRSYALRLAASF